MPIKTPRSARASLAGITSQDPDNCERLAAARRDLAAANLKAHIARVVAEAPPLTPEQCAELSRILYPAGEWVLLPETSNESAEDLGGMAA